MAATGNLAIAPRSYQHSLDPLNAGLAGPPPSLAGAAVRPVYDAATSNDAAPTRRCSEREPADWLRDKSTVSGGCLPSLTFTFGAIQVWTLN